MLFVMYYQMNIEDLLWAINLKPKIVSSRIVEWSVVLNGVKADPSAS